jgi:23S rRNA pseudouridine1911/1915/1917 synthase
MTPSAPPSADDLDESEAQSLRFAVDAARAGERLDKLLAELAPDLSRSRVKALILDGHVALDDAVATDPARKAKAGQTIALTVPEAAPAEPAAEAIPLVVVFEDEHLIVIDKPAGMVVHPAAGHETGTLVNALLHHCGESLSGIGGVRRPGIVHRLDKDTSGLLVVAKHDRAHQGLADQFRDHGREGALIREYRAFVWGKPDRRHGTIEANLDRSSANREKMAVVAHDKGRHAITHYEFIESFDGASAREVASLIACRLETGRTHQIRVHMAHAGHPLLADALYGAGFRTKAAQLAASAQGALAALGERQALHAALLGFEHPITGDVLEFESEFPADLAALHAALRHTQA